MFIVSTEAFIEGRGKWRERKGKDNEKLREKGDQSAKLKDAK